MAGALLLAAAGLLWWAGRSEPAGQTVTSVGASGALELTVPIGPSPPPSALATTTAAASPMIASPEAGPPTVTMPEAGPPTVTMSEAGPPTVTMSEAGPPTVTMSPVAPPARLRITALGVDAAVTPVGVDDGELQVPDDVDTIGWYRFGPAPGGTGSAVLVGHVDDYRQGVGVLARIGDLNPGDLIGVVDDNGVNRPFVVVAREQWPKDETPLGRLFDRGGQPRLVLITCGGTFDANRLEYDDNIAVTAAPAG